VTLEGYGTLRHGFFYVRNIPVFYLPWLMYPAKRKRQSGFLMPTFANSSVRGFDARLPFFVDISPSVDATVVSRICSNRAAQASLEFRYFPYEDLNGRLYGEYTYDWKYGPQSNPNSHRFYVTWLHDQALVERVRLKANANWVSDRDYFEFWGDRFDRRLRVLYLESNAVVGRQWNNFLFQAEARHFDNLDLRDNSFTVQNLPIVTGTLFNQQIPYTPFYMSSDLVFSNYYAPKMHNQWLGSRLQMDTRLRLPVALGRFLKVEPSMTYFAKAYAASYYERDRAVDTVRAIRTDLYQVNADAFTDLNAVYERPWLGFQRIKHTVRPRVSWTYRPFASQKRFPVFDETDQLDRISILNAEMRQTLTGRLGPHEYLDFISLSLSQGYDFNLTRDSGNWLTEKFPFLYGWTNTHAELTVKPHSLVDLSAQAEYDPVLNRARKYSFNVGLMDHRGDLLRVVHQFTEDQKREDLNRQTNVNLQVKLTPNLDCFFENQFTHQFNFSYFTSFGVNYHPQCWNVMLRYSEVREQDPVTQKIKDADQTVFMTLSLYGLGQVYRFTRDWGEILGHSPESGVSATR
jgi:LPS-assembly protein